MRVLTVLLLCCSSVALAKGPSIDKVNGAIHTEAGVEYGDLDTVNGAIRVREGATAEDVSTVNGSIDVDDGVRLRSAETVNGGIDLGRDVLVEGRVETVNGSISLGQRSQVMGGLETVNGGMKLREASVEGGLSTVNGSIYIGENSTVRGGILIEKPNSGWFNWGAKNKPPRLTIGPNAVVEDKIHFEREVELVVHPSAKIGPISGETPTRIDYAQVER
ncbi:hypothetical protein [Pseudomarimonas arenosa]|uniref:Polymer-forming cytoskeletal protein n=1 Tax=Pseudomarimonas arenosa TaxID=2774145 RepID=A0AAW3ZSA1_9GAMM|nr:hypothetical protein [Pseudomarimonas arenosa]MBD8527934.1 hypothetical protein [Pseudomarimonas arenosa]